MAGIRGSLLIADGDLPALVACAAATGEARRGVGEEPAPVAWVPAFGGSGGVERVEAARRQGDLYGIELLEDETLSRCGPDADGWEATLLLIRACRAAAGRSMRSVIWPVHAGPELDLDRVARGVDRALLVSRLAGIDGAPGVEVRAPYVDFTDDQIADLVLDMDLPVRTCWWWEPRSEAARALRERWGRALARVGWMDVPEVGAGAGVAGQRAASGVAAAPAGPGAFPIR